MAAGVLILGATLAPFDPEWSVPHAPERLGEALRWTTPGWDLAGHLVVFFLFGGLCSLAAGPRTDLRHPWRLVLAVAAMTLALEVLQTSQAGRHARLIDWLCHASATSAAIIGLGRARRLRGLRARLGYLLGRTLPGWGAALALAASLAWTWAAIVPTIRLSRLNWDHTMPLSIANEADGSRPWLGTIRLVAFYDRAARAREFITLEDSGDPDDPLTARARSGMLLGYDFKERRHAGTLMADIPGSPDIDFTHEPASDLAAAPAGDPVALPAADLSRRLESAGSFAVEFWIQPANLSQTGPARIVSLSRDAHQRNLTIGQDGADLEFRVRNAVSGENGTIHALRARGVLDGSAQRFIASFDHGVSTLRDGTGRQVASVDLRDPALHLGLGSGPGGRAIAAVLLIVLVALPSASLLDRRSAPVRHGFAIGGVMFFGVLPAIVAFIGSGAPSSLIHLPWLVAAVLVVYPTAYRFITEPANLTRARDS